MLTNRQIADADDEITEQIEALTAARKDLYTIHREDLLAAGRDKADVLIEMAALKAAVAKRRKLRGAKGDDVRSKDEATDEILCEIMADPASAHDARVDRSKRRLSESMKDQAELSAEMAAIGLIPEEAHAETVRLANAISRKLGDGAPVDAPIAAAAKRTLAEIAGDYRPTTVRKTPVEDEGIPDFLRRA